MNNLRGPYRDLKPADVPIAEVVWRDIVHHEAWNDQIATEDIILHVLTFPGCYILENTRDRLVLARGHDDRSGYTDIWAIPKGAVISVDEWA